MIERVLCIKFTVGVISIGYNYTFRSGTGLDVLLGKKRRILGNVRFGRIHRYRNFHEPPLFFLGIFSGRLVSEDDVVLFN